MPVRKMLCTSVLALVALAHTSQSADAAGQCTLRDAEPQGKFEAAKKAFFDLDAEALQALFVAPVSLGALEQLILQVRAPAPDGFSDCATIVQRVDDGGMVQEVTHFLTKDGDAEVFLYVVGYPGHDGVTGLRSINFNTDFDEVLGLLR